MEVNKNTLNLIWIIASLSIMGLVGFLFSIMDSKSMAKETKKQQEILILILPNLSQNQLDCLENNGGKTCLYR